MRFLILPLIVLAQVANLKQGDRIKVSVLAISQHPILGTVTEISPYAITLSAKDSVLFVPHSIVNSISISKGKKRHA